MTWFDVGTDQRRHRRQVQRRLGDVVARVRLDQRRELFLLGARRHGTDQHAVAARLVDRLHHQFVQVRQHVGPFVGPIADIAGHVRQQRRFIEVEADEVRHPGVHGLVVRHACARRIGQGDVACLPRAHQSGDPQRRISAKRLRIDEQIVDAPVDHVDAGAPMRRVHVHAIVPAHDQVAALHEFATHLLREIRMLEVGGVEHPRGEHDDFRMRALPWRQRSQRFEQLRRVFIDRQNRVVLEQFRKHALHHVAVFQHVRHAGRHAQVVLEHVHHAVAAAHQIAAAHVRPHAEARRNAHALGTEVRRVGEEFGGENAVLDDALFVIDVVDEHVQRLYALAQAQFDVLPFLARDNAWDEIERPRAIDGTVLGGVHRERDAHFLDRAVQRLNALGNVAIAQPTQVLRQFRRAVTDPSAALQFVVNALGRIVRPANCHVNGSTSTDTESVMCPPPNTMPRIGETSP